MEKIFRNLRVRLFLAREVQYFEFGIFSFNSYVYYRNCCFVVWTRAFNLPTRAFNLSTRAFSFLTCGFKFVIRGFELITCGFELVTRGFELLTRGFEPVTRVLLFHIKRLIKAFSCSKAISLEDFSALVGGDLHQLPPVHLLTFYSLTDNLNSDTIKDLNCLLLWHLF